MRIHQKTHVSSVAQSNIVAPETAPSAAPMSDAKQALALIGKAPSPRQPAKVSNVMALLTGAQMVRFAAIDLGSSSAKLLVLEKTSAGWKTILDRKIGCALGKNVPAGGPIPDENISRAASALKELAACAEALGISSKDIPVITTAVVRNSSNGQAVTDTIERTAGLSDIRILSGDDEAQAGFNGALAMMNGAPGKYATLDLGGGSFQLAIGTEKGLEHGGSTQIGSNYVLEKLLPKEILTADDFASADQALLRAAPMPLDPRAVHGRTLIATGGISKFLRAHFRTDTVSAAQIDALRREMGALAYDARTPFIQNGKDDETRVALGVDTETGARDYGVKLVASTTLLLHILHGIGASEVRVSETDARHALIQAKAKTL